MIESAGPVARIRGDDLEEASADAAEIFYPNRMDAKGGTFGIDLRAARIGAVTAGLVRFATETTTNVDALEVAYHVNFGIDGGIRNTVGPTELTADPQTAAVFPPVGASAISGWSSGTEELLLLKIERDAVHHELRAMIGRDVRGEVRFDPNLDLRRGLGAQYKRLAMTLAGAVTRADEDDPSWHPLLAARLSDATIAGLLLACGNQFSDLLHHDPRKAAPAAISRAVDIIEARAGEPLTVSSIAAEVGVSVRALQEGMQRHLGCSPGQYLTQVRFERARGALRRANPATVSATSVALTWGFGNYGRFAARYRERYGESPGQTLRSGGPT
jgi:AraC-like DNA-binding protein